jgi:elongation factor Ts
MISIEDIKSLRDKTGISIALCKKALEEAKGDEKKAMLILRAKSSDAAEKKSGRTLAAGTIASYVHGEGKVAVLLELSTETDFVAKTDEFKALARELAMQVAATRPKYATEAGIPKEDVKKARTMFAKDAKGKPKELKEKIISGKLAAHFQDSVLLSQMSIRDPERSVKDMIDGAIQKFGEKIAVTRFTRYSISD